VFMDGRELAGPSLERGVVFQSHALMPWLTVRKNIAFAVESRWRDWSSYCSGLPRSSIVKSTLHIASQWPASPARRGSPVFRRDFAVVSLHSPRDCRRCVLAQCPPHAHSVMPVAITGQFAAISTSFGRQYPPVAQITCSRDDVRAFDDRRFGGASRENRALRRPNCDR